MIASLTDEQKRALYQRFQDECFVDGVFSSSKYADLLLTDFTRAERMYFKALGFGWLYGKADA